MISHVSDDHCWSDQLLSVVVRDLKTKLVLRQKYLSNKTCDVTGTDLNHQHDLHVVQTVQTKIVNKVRLHVKFPVINLVKQVEDEHHSAQEELLQPQHHSESHLSWIYWRLRGSLPL